MANDEKHALEQGLAISREFSRQQFRLSAAMLFSAAIAYALSAYALHQHAILSLAVAAATGLTAGVVSSPNTFRRKNGSLATAYGLLAFMWGLAAMTVALPLVG